MKQLNADLVGEICFMIVMCCFREEPIDYGALETSLKKSCLKSGLKDVEGKTVLTCTFLH